MTITYDTLENWFKYHPPKDEAQIDSYVFIRKAGLHLAQAIFEQTPAGPDQIAAIRKVREAVMTANAGIACDSQ